MSKFWKWTIGIIGVIAGVSLIVSLVVVINSLSKRIYTAPIQTVLQRRQESFDVIVPKSSAEQTLETTTVENQAAVFYQNQVVERINGTFSRLIGGKTLEVNLQEGVRWFFPDKDTKFVCQPGGHLNTNDGVPADDVFIEDKTNGNIGIPWGIEITLDNIIARVNPQSEVQVYFRPQAGSLAGMPKVVYIWFKKCN